METAHQSDLTRLSAANWTKALAFVATGVALAAAGIYLGETDDAPGAALMGIVLMIGLMTRGVRTVRRKCACGAFDNTRRQKRARRRE